MSSFLCDEDLLIGMEMRTSPSSLCSLDGDTLQAIGVNDLFPMGECAGLASGIVSAAIDGTRW